MLHRAYPTRSDIFVGFQNLRTDSRSDISDPGRTYPMYQTYPASSRVLEPWQPGPIGYILPLLDIFNPSDISDSTKISRIGFGIRDNLEGLNDFLQGKTSHPIYMKGYSRLR
jgi:hypothetical protein